LLHNITQLLGHVGGGGGYIGEGKYCEPYYYVIF
jgi:hypothetical protein